jgi:hypothetical protein
VSSQRLTHVRGAPHFSSASRRSTLASSRELTAEQRRALWFWLAEGWHDNEAPEVRRAASLIRELAEHAATNTQQITLEMYEEPMSGLATTL